MTGLFRFFIIASLLFVGFVASQQEMPAMDEMDEAEFLERLERLQQQQQQQQQQPEAQPPALEPIPLSGFPGEEEGLQVIQMYLPPDCQRRSQVGDHVAVHYTGKVYGTEQVFDSSYQREPIRIQLGMGNVIRGWEYGLQDMCIGEQRVLIIPPELGYGQQGHPPAIPPAATLHFETVLVDIAVTTVSYMQWFQLLGGCVLLGVVGHFALRCAAGMDSQISGPHRSSKVKTPKPSGKKRPKVA